MGYEQRVGEMMVVVHYGGGAILNSCEAPSSYFKRKKTSRENISGRGKHLVLPSQCNKTFLELHH